ncbi:S-adenosyl-L-methionine-dependent methyltransferase [Dichomitus squalens]|uniref:DNA (cytosine-5-)-methyltransferase n=1 Tax=Dichomitus squalens TaxID=114155 RepID=A0A4Q9MY68_9APHY|nr:S-adenosyl-L-methionine-dependent methyltransferase [Dichomitus squalens]
MSRRRHTAFTLSFPEENVASASSPSLLVQPQDPTPVPIPSSASYRAAKRRRTDAPAAEHVDKRLRRDAVLENRVGGPPVRKLSYQPHPDEIQENEDTIVQGEDADDYLDEEAKPVRILSDFAIFDPRHGRGFELVSLELLHVTAGTDHHFEAAGNVSPVYLNEEDAGQEDIVDNSKKADLQRLRTSAIFRYFIDYQAVDDPLYVETQYGWYILKSPTVLYRNIHRRFYTPHRIAQIVISVALEGLVTTYAEFAELYLGRWDDLLNDHVQTEDLARSVALVKSILDDDPALRTKVTSRPFVQHIFDTLDKKHTPYPVQHMILPADSRASRPRPFFQPNKVTGNLDLAVLRPENQNPTHVTPLIDTLALGLFREHLKVVGAAPKRLTGHELRQRQLKVRGRIGDLLMRRIDNRSTIDFPQEERLDGQYWKAVKIGQEVYKLGDCVIVLAGEHKHRPAPNIPQDLNEVPEHASVGEYFWFARIVYIDQREKTAHVQYYEHSSKTYLEEISNPQELFLCPQYCGTIALRDVLGKAVVCNDYRPGEGEDFDPLHFFCRFMYDDLDGSFKDVDTSDGDALDPPDNCPACLLSTQRQSDLVPTIIRGGMTYLGSTYHHDDYALISNAKQKKVPALVGMVIRIRPKRQDDKIEGTIVVTVKLLGRIADLLSEPSFAAPADAFAHERELFMTGLEMDVSGNDLIKRCSVLHHSSRTHMDAWLARSPYHFFVRYSSQTLEPKTWNGLTELSRKKIPVCQVCFQEDEVRTQQLKAFTRQQPRACLRGFDPFAGVGAFGLPMEATGCIKITHAIEISPSAAATMQKNSPHTTVYNQCSNIVLRYAVKSRAKQWEGPPPLDIQGKAPLPDPPKPGEIDCIIAGFPCQPHSTLNMFQKANDRKSHLLLNLLSWIDYLQPKYCVFENVRGFLNYNLNASQAGRYRMVGGIKMGGLKFFINALLTLGYQVHFSLLQAGQYGTPQRRVRFFLLASRKSYPLPSFPLPTHAVLNPDALSIRFPNGVEIKPIITGGGTAPFRAVCIRDAIDDLVAFDWKDPGKNGMKARKGVLSIECDPKKPYCGPLGDYARSPRNSYQKACRTKPATELQHYTRTFKHAVVSRITNVPLKSRADYRFLPDEHSEWQFRNPASATARLGFRPGMYGRLDEKDWFHTTVTNVDPTAKQSYVLHPKYRRIFTIRELARSQGFPDWFTFVAHGDRMKTLHRQIGNAVPWQVGEALGRELERAMFEKWKQDRDGAIQIDDD